MRQELLSAPEVLTSQSRGDFQAEAARALEKLGEAPGGRLIVDLSRTRSIDSAGLSALVMVQVLAGERRHTVVLRGASEEARLLLLMTGVEDRFLMEGGTEAPPPA
jgi:anti-anti-sigma regulatory factor